MVYLFWETVFQLLRKLSIQPTTHTLQHLSQTDEKLQSHKTEPEYLLLLFSC